MMCLSNFHDPHMEADVRFGRVLSNFAVAKAEAFQMRDLEAPPTVRDRSTAAYVTAVDAIVADLTVLDRQGILERLYNQLKAEQTVRTGGLG